MELIYAVIVGFAGGVIATRLWYAKAIGEWKQAKAWVKGEALRVPAWLTAKIGRL